MTAGERSTAMRFPAYFAPGKAPVLSFEIYPPKTEKAMRDLDDALPRLVALKPTFITVTYGALGSTRERTLDVVERIRREYAVETASHITCVGASRGDVDRILERLRAASIENVVALRGDPPRGESAFVPVEGGFAHANELVEHIRGRGGFGIAVAGYPEKHVEAPDFETDLRNLKRKVEAGADCVITQLFFDNAHYFRFVERARELGIRVPIVPGILPAQSLGQVRRMTSLCGATIPPRLERALETAAPDEKAMEDVGVRWATEQCLELIERGAPGLHFFVLNRAGQMERILPAIRPSLEARLGPGA